MCGHLTFLLIHVAAAVIFFPALLVTVPLHLIYTAVTAGRGRR